MAERTKRCTGPCGQTKPWSGFDVRTRWPDGSTRTVTSRCAECRRKATAERMARRRAADPEAERARLRDLRAKINADPKLKRAYDESARASRTAYRRRKGEKPRVFAAPRAEPVDAEPAVRLPVGPFQEWVLEQLGHFDGCVTTLSAALEVDPRMVYAWLHEGRGTVSLDVADRALCRAGESGRLGELWPELYDFAP